MKQIHICLYATGMSIIVISILLTRYSPHVSAQIEATVTPQPTIEECQVATKTSLRLSSSPNDSVGQGQNISLDRINSWPILTIYTDLFHKTVIETSWKTKDLSRLWTTKFAITSSQVLTVGLYNQAIGYPSGSNFPEIDVYSSKSSCYANVKGLFEIKELKMKSNQIQCLAISFEQTCGNQPPLTGILLYKLTETITPTSNHKVYLPYITKSPLICQIAKETKLEWASTPGDFISQGKNLYLDKNNSDTEIVIDNDRRISLCWLVIGSIYSWYTTFSAKNGQKLTTGIYESALRDSEDTNKPGMDISGYGRGCNKINGKFEIQELEKVNNKLVCLAINFEQSCDNGPILKGSLHLNQETKH